MLADIFTTVLNDVIQYLFSEGLIFAAMLSDIIRPVYI